jgi:DNA-binding beta-propeller fold protein YncE
MTPLTRALAVAALSAAAITLGTPLGALAQGIAGLGAALQEVRRLGLAGDHARALAIVDSVAVHYPDHPSVVFARALALGRAGRPDEAADAARRLLRWDARYAALALADSAMRDVRPAVAALDVPALRERAERPVARAHVWAVLAERDLVPEGTAWDPATRAVLVGSLHKRKVVAIAPDGSVRDRVPPGAGGLASVVGIHVDARRGVLWVASNARFDRDDDTTSSMLYAFDAASGAFRARYPVPAPGPHFLNDVTTGPDGAAYVTDSRADRVWTVRPGAGALAPFAPAGEPAAPNGITVSADGRHLFVAATDHVRVVALGGEGGGRSWRLAVPDSVAVAGIDGLAFVAGRPAAGEPDALIAHHPLAFWRVARYPLDAAHRAVIGRELVEWNTPDARTSTTGEVAGDHYVFIGNSQIDRMNARAVDSATMHPVRIYRAPLRRLTTGLVAVALSARDSVALLDAQTLDRVATLPVGRNPHEIAASPDGRRAYVADARDTTITVLDATPPRVPRVPRVAARWRLPDGVRVHDVAASADGRTVWAASGERRLVLELDAATGRVRRRLPLARAGSWMLEAPAAGAAGRLVVAHLEGGAVSLVHPRTGRATVLEAREGEIDAAPTPDGREVWSVNLRDGHLTVHDAAGGGVPRRLPAGREPGRVAFTRDGRLALVVDGADSTVVAFDARTKERVAAATVPAGPKVIALSPDGRRAYVTHPARGLLTLLDVPSMTALRSVPLAGAPDGVAVLEGR